MPKFCHLLILLFYPEDGGSTFRRHVIDFPPDTKHYIPEDGAPYLYRQLYHLRSLHDDQFRALGVGFGSGMALNDITLITSLMTDPNKL
jgi:hypothetical protein